MSETEKRPKMDLVETKELAQTSGGNENKILNPTKICSSILNDLVENLNLKKRKRQDEDLVAKNGAITITKVQGTDEKKTPTFRCMLCNAKIRFPPDEMGENNISPRYNRAAKAKYRNHLMAEHNANGRYPGMELLVRTTFEQQFPSPLQTNGILGNTGFVIPEKYRLPTFQPFSQKSFQPKVIMEEEDIEEEDNDDEVKAIKTLKEKKSNLQITLVDDNSNDGSAYQAAKQAAKEKHIAKKKKISEESKEVPITVDSGDESEGSDDESGSSSDSDSSINSVDEDDDEEDDEFKEFKSMELDSAKSSSDKLPLPASIREDLDLAQKKIPGPTINKLTGLPFGWKKEVSRRDIGSQGFDIIVRNPNGKVFKTKSDLRKYCALYPNKTMGINPDAVFTSGIKPSKPVEVDLDKDEEDVECIDL